MPSKRVGETDDEYRDRLRGYRAGRRAIDAESKREWRKRNPVAFKEIVKRYRERNPDLRRAEKATRRARIRGVGGAHTKGDIKAIHDSQRGRCANCQSELVRFEVDHVVPIALGGKNDRSNLQLLCPPCNRRKGAKHPIEFAQEMGRLL